MNIEHSTSNLERPTSNVQRSTSKAEESESEWFREPSQRERRIAAWLFIGFAVFFFGLAWVQRGWWFAWVVLGLAGFSLWYAGHQEMSSRRDERETPSPKSEARINDE